MSSAALGTCAVREDAWEGRISVLRVGAGQVWGPPKPPLAGQSPGDRSQRSLPSSGTIHCVFHSSGNHYTWKKVTTTVHNIIVGKLWIDQVG